MLDDQRGFLRWLLDVVRELRVELVVVAGDVFDRAIPPAEAVAVLVTEPALRSGSCESE